MNFLNSGINRFIDEYKDKILLNKKLSLNRKIDYYKNPIFIAH